MYFAYKQLKIYLCFSPLKNIISVIESAKKEFHPLPFAFLFSLSTLFKVFFAHILIKFRVANAIQRT